MHRFIIAHSKSEVLPPVYYKMQKLIQQRP